MTGTLSALDLDASSSLVWSIEGTTEVFWFNRH